MRAFVVYFLMLIFAVQMGPVTMCAQSLSQSYLQQGGELWQSQQLCEEQIHPQNLGDSLGAMESVYKFKPQQLIAPTVLVGAGAIGMQIDAVKEFDFGFNKVHKDHIVAEDIAQYVPAASYYLLNLSGVQSTHEYLDATVILAISAAFTAVSVKVMKEIAGVERPNGNGYHSFPSGHSATAFMSAEFLRMEYKDTSPWIGIAGYAVATGTALARIKHKEHWFTDVLAGAGFGILCTKAAYWVYPWVQDLLFDKIFKCKKNTAFVGIPYYTGNAAGVSLALNF